MALFSSRMACAALAAAFASLPALASADQALIDYRQAVMHSIGGHTSALAAIVKGNVPYTGDAAVHARAIQPLADMAQHVFPPESQKGKTEALPAIWEQPEKFKEAMSAFQTAAANLAKVADGDAAGMAPALGALGKTCKGCHDDFRKKE